jgi:protocatechuate 3,4-dioxygenase beta subunit
MRTRIAVTALLICAALGYLLWSSQRAPGDVETRPAADSAAARSTEQAALGGGTSQPASQPAHVALTEEGEARAYKRGPEELWGRVVTAGDLRPVAGAEVELIHRDADDFWNLDLEYGEQKTSLATTHADAEGRFLFRVPRARPHRLRVFAVGYAERTVLACTGGAEIVVELAPGAVVEGVVKEQGGAPVGGVAVRIAVRGESVELAKGTTAPDGTFRFGGLEACRVHVQVCSPRHPEKWEDLEIQADRTNRVEVLLEPGRVVRGRVSDAATGAPIAGAEIASSWTFKNPVRSGADGSYRLAGVEQQRAKLYVQAQGYARATRTLASNEKEPVADFLLQRGGAVRGRFVDGEGKPPRGAYAAAAAKYTMSPGYVHTDWRRAAIEVDGTFFAGGLDPQHWHMLYVRCAGFGIRVYDIGRKIGDGEVVDLGDIVLRPAGGLEGRVTDGDGKPVPGVTVGVRGKNSDWSRWSGKDLAGAESRVVDQFAARSARAGPDGVFRFTNLAAGTYDVNVRIPGRQDDVRAGSFAVADGMVRDDVVIVVDRGLSISGAVSIPAQAAGIVRGLRVRAYAPKSHKGEFARVLPDGSFEVAWLQPGSYVLSAYDPPSGWTITPRRGVEAGAHDVRLVLEPAMTIEGRVVDAQGRPARARLALWWKDAIANSSRLYSTDEQGNFRLEVPPSFFGRLTAQHVDAMMGPGAVAEDVVAGTRDLVLTLKDQPPGAGR